MITVVRNLNPSSLAIKASAVFGFLGVYGDARQTLEPNVKDCIAELSDILMPRACYSEYDIKSDGELLDLGFTKIKSKDLSEHIEGCRHLILIAATVGIGADRLVSKYSVSEPSRGLIMQAVGSAAVEASLFR